MLAVGGAEEDGTVIELERIEETAHRVLDLIVPWSRWMAISSVTNSSN